MAQRNYIRDLHNSDLPTNGNPVNPPSFPPISLESCTFIVAQVYIPKTEEFRPYKVLVKTGEHSTFFGNHDRNTAGTGAGDNVREDCYNDNYEEYEDDSDYSSSCASSDKELEEEDQEEEVEEEEVQEETAYLFVRKLSKAIYGCIMYARVLKKSSHPPPRPPPHSSLSSSNYNRQQYWVLTDEECAIKVISREKLQDGQNRNMAEDGEKECAALKFIHSKFFAHHPLSVNINRSQTDPTNSTLRMMRETNNTLQIESLYDVDNIYSVMPYINGGELYALLEVRRRFSDEEVRFIMKQVLHGLKWLHRVGVCHRDVSLENLMIDQNGDVYLIDMGMSLRMPYSETNSSGSGGGDVLNDALNGMTLSTNGNTLTSTPLGGRGRSSGTATFRQMASSQNENGSSVGDLNVEDHTLLPRRYIAPQGQAGKMYYMSPEIYYNKRFDGHAIDVWSAGVTFYIMLTGEPPWNSASFDDAKFRNAIDGNLSRMLDQFNNFNSRRTGNAQPIVSYYAKDLLQSMFHLEPKNRLSLDQILDHEWMRGPMKNPMTQQIL